jgi:hypothetical protein
VNNAYAVLERAGVYCLAMKGKNGEREKAWGGMIKVQPERQEEHGRGETEGIGVLG